MKIGGKSKKRGGAVVALAKALATPALLSLLLSVSILAAVDRVNFDMNLPASLLGIGSAEFFRELKTFGNIMKREGEIDFNVNIKDSVGDIIKRMEAEKTDIAWLPPYYYERVRATNPNSKIRPLVIYKGNGSIKSPICIYVRKNSPIKRVEDLKGKRISYPDEIGWVMFNYIYDANKAEPGEASGVGKNFARFKRLARESSAMALRYNSIDAIVLEQLYIDYLPPKKDQDPLMAELVCTEPLPNTTLVYRYTFDQRLKEVMELVFTSMNNAPEFTRYRKFFKTASGQWTSVSDRDLDAWKRIYSLSVKNGWEKRYKNMPK